MTEMQLINELPTALLSDNDQTAMFDMGVNNNCHLHPHCTAHINLTSLLDSNPNQLDFRLAIRNKLISGDELVLSTYPGQFKRPPKA